MKFMIHDPRSTLPIIIMLLPFGPFGTGDPDSAVLLYMELTKTCIPSYNGRIKEQLMQMATV